MTQTSIDNLLPPEFRKIEEETKKELYLSSRIIKAEYGGKFPWHVVRYKDFVQRDLDVTLPQLNAKVTLGKILSSCYILVQVKGDLYVAFLNPTDEESELGVPIERTITSVPRTDKNGDKHKAARLVVEGYTLGLIGCDIGDRCDLYTVPSTPERVGFLKIVPKKRLK